MDLERLIEQLTNYGFNNEPETTSWEVLNLGRIQPEPFRTQLKECAEAEIEGRRLARASAIALSNLLAEKQEVPE